MNTQPGNYETEDAREASRQAKDYAQQEMKQLNIEKPHSIEEAKKKRSISENKFSLTGYDYDIFISSSALDNATANNQEEGWVQEFYKNLQVLLAQLIGSIDGIKIWWSNEELGDSISFDTAYEDAINRSAIMLSLTSPAYLHSRYCIRELKTFCEKAQHGPLGLKVIDRSRLFNVLLYNVPVEQWPEELRGTVGFTFYNAESEEDRGKPMNVKDPQFKIQLRELGDCIIKLINEFPKSDNN